MATPVFNRPREFDQNFQQQIVEASKKVDFRDKFGLGDDPDTGGDEGGSDNEDEQVSSTGEDFEGLYTKYNELLKSNQALESQLQAKNTRIEELQRLSKQSQALLVNKHKDLIKALSEEYEQNKGKWKLAMLESGGDAAKLEAKIKVMDLTKENSSLREQIKELELVAMDLMRDLQDAKEKAEIKSTTTTSSTTSVAPPIKSPNGVKGAPKKEGARTTAPTVAKTTGAPTTKKEEKDVNDLKKKLKEQDLKIKNLTTELQTSGGGDDSAVAELKLENEKLREEIKELKKTQTNVTNSGPSPALEKELAKANETIAKLKEQLKTGIQEETEKFRNERDKLMSENHSLNQKIENLSKKLQSSNANTKKGKEVYTKVKAYNQTVKEDINFIRSTLGKMNGLFTGIVPQVSKALEDWKKKSAGRLSQMTVKYNEAVGQYKKESALRKKYFNQIQELRGNIRVYCRVRPLSDQESKDDNVVTFPEEGILKISSHSDRKTNYQFEFEKIYQQSATQAEIFEDVKDLVISVLDGYNVCIFAYGQTGSGKTYTMEGPKENPGLYSRTLKKLFEEANKVTDCEFTISTSLLEIYNDNLRDLMDPSDTELKITKGAYGNEVNELKKIEVDSEQAVLEILVKGAKNRTTAATKMNDRSSRSHLVLSVYVKAKNTLTNTEFMGKLHLIDLAGSERVKLSGVEGDRLKEAQAINLSLSALGNCISARANKTTHVPYRDSTLTFLLQDSLEKNSKTLMVVQISPTASNAPESVCSLKFAERVRKVELGKAEKNTVKGTK